MVMVSKNSERKEENTENGINSNVQGMERSTNIAYMPAIVVLPNKTIELMLCFATVLFWVVSVLPAHFPMQ